LIIIPTTRSWWLLLLSRLIIRLHIIIGECGWTYRGHSTASSNKNMRTLRGKSGLAELSSLELRAVLLDIRCATLSGLHFLSIVGFHPWCFLVFHYCYLYLLEVGSVKVSVLLFIRFIRWYTRDGCVLDRLDVWVLIVEVMTRSLLRIHLLWDVEVACDAAYFLRLDVIKVDGVFIVPWAQVVGKYWPWFGMIIWATIVTIIRVIYIVAILSSYHGHVNLWESSTITFSKGMVTLLFIINLLAILQVPLIVPCCLLSLFIVSTANELHTLSILALPISIVDTASFSTHLTTRI
jgi:hypothetical protein